MVAAMMSLRMVTSDSILSASPWRNRGPLARLDAPNGRGLSRLGRCGRAESPTALCRPPAEADWFPYCTADGIIHGGHYLSRWREPMTLPSVLTIATELLSRGTVPMTETGRQPRGQTQNGERDAIDAPSTSGTFGAAEGHASQRQRRATGTLGSHRGAPQARLHQLPLAVDAAVRLRHTVC